MAKPQLLMLVTLLGIDMEIRFVQEENVHSFISVTPLGIEMEVKPVQVKASCPIFVTLFGIEIEVKPVQEKAASPIFVTLLGMVIEISPAQPINAQDSMHVTPLGIVDFLHPAIIVLDEVSIIALQLSRESYFVFPFSTPIEIRLRK